MRSLYRQPRPPRDRACPRGEAAAVLAAQSGRLSEEAALSVSPRMVPAYLGDDRPLPCRHRAAIAGFQRTRYHSLRHPRLLPPCRAARSAAAARGLHLEPATRPRLAARPLGGPDPPRAP